VIRVLVRTMESETTSGNECILLVPRRRAYISKFEKSALSGSDHLITSTLMIR
jgi:hypothetical protein